MTLAAKVLGKMRAARTLARMIYLFRNWRDVWAGYRGKGPVPPLVLRSGLRLEHGPGDDVLSLYDEIFTRQDYTGGGFYRPRIGDTVLDIGANIGTFTLYLQHRARGIRIHCFEPAVETRRRLEHNLKINGLDGAVTVHPVGVADQARRLVLHGNSFTGRRSVLPSTPDGLAQEDEEIECITLADAVRRTGAGRIDLLKIDVEGAEVDILQEADPETWSKIQRVALEFHGSLRSGARQSVEQALRARGFHRIRVDAAPPDGQDGTIQAGR
jgi:FkbM family methyltransferase